MFNNDTRTLFNYLRDILYMPDCEKLDKSCVGKEYAELCDGLNVLHDYIQELREYSQKLSDGDYDYVNPSKENQLCWGLKTMQTKISSLEYMLESIYEGRKPVCPQLDSMDLLVIKLFDKLSEQEKEIKALKSQLSEK